jgi:hypothetical protein
VFAADPSPKLHEYDFALVDVLVNVTCKLDTTDVKLAVGAGTDPDVTVILLEDVLVEPSLPVTVNTTV